MSQLSYFQKGEENNYEFEYKGSPVSVFVPPGIYFLEVFGSEGGRRLPQDSTTKTGLGGYSCGTLGLNRETLLFVYVGGKGEDCSSCSSVSGGFNGGGYVTGAYSAGGGGGSDIRVESEDFHHRIIVAGGGGGLEYSVANGYGGSGGGFNGQDGYQPNYDSKQGGGGSGTSPGIHHGSGGPAPGFGYGGSSLIGHTGAGGGGWYGGGAGEYSEGNGGGGSGYVYTAEKSHQYPLPKPSEEYFLTNVTSENGIRSGHGFVRIKLIGPSHISHHSHIYPRIPFPITILNIKCLLFSLLV